ncbi:AroM family protein [Salipiger sp. 1_MG-2023]|uniref:AroM family protein n=1 Tax=Salipiger sp. 1_MG-2023 TaxID=3062665 RepID=UPI0026E35D1B|nr:AroM family protein [Salipiger sp. 1_MG-2023]MDO6587854.1 AroM family protein [Salipiger sp. 1_MG-2023]
MSRPVVGLLVVGQSPRPALQEEFRHVLPAGAAELKLLGALDHLDAAGLAAAAPTSDADTLYTTLPDGRSVFVSKAAVTEGMRARLDDLARETVDVALIACTGKFPGLEAPGVHFASDLITGAVDGCLPGAGRLGVFIPSPAQAAACLKRWERPGRTCFAVPLQPDADAASVRAAAQEMAEQAPDLVVHDCISYTRASRQLAASIHGKQAILAAAICARFAAELSGA